MKPEQKLPEANQAADGLKALTWLVTKVLVDQFDQTFNPGDWIIIGIFEVRRAIQQQLLILVGTVIFFCFIVFGI